MKANLRGYLRQLVLVEFEAANYVLRTIAITPDAGFKRLTREVVVSYPDSQIVEDTKDPGNFVVTDLDELIDKVDWR